MRRVCTQSPSLQERRAQRSPRLEMVEVELGMRSAAFRGCFDGISGTF